MSEPALAGFDAVLILILLAVNGLGTIPRKLLNLEFLGNCCAEEVIKLCLTVRKQSDLRRQITLKDVGTQQIFLINIAKTLLRICHACRTGMTKAAVNDRRFW